MTDNRWPMSRSLRNVAKKLRPSDGQRSSRPRAGRKAAISVGLLALSVFGVWHVVRADEVTLQIPGVPATMPSQIANVTMAPATEPAPMADGATAPTTAPSTMVNSSASPRTNPAAVAGATTMPTTAPSQADAGPAGPAPAGAASAGAAPGGAAQTDVSQLPPVAPPSEQIDSLDGTFIGITKPSQELKLTFYSPGIIASVPVKEGDAVKKDQVLMTQDSEIEALEYRAMKTESDSPLTIDYAKADYEAKKVLRDRLQAASEKGVANQTELEEAIDEAEEAKIKIAVAQNELDQKKIETEKQGAKVARMQLLSPIDGIVQKLNQDVGAMIDPNQPDGTIVVVKIDPIWIDLHLNSAQAAKLKKGDEMEVKYDGDDQWLAVRAHVNFMDPMVDAASDTQYVRLEMPNPANRPAGLHVTVRTPAPAVSAGAAN